MHRVRCITVTVSGRREWDKQLRVWPGTKHGRFTAQVPHINSHRVEVIAWVYWHTECSQKPRGKAGKTHFKQGGKPNKNQRQSRPNNTPFLRKNCEQLHTTKTPMTFLFFKMPIVSEQPPQETKVCKQPIHSPKTS
jgi:hypothetical protein